AQERTQGATVEEAHGAARSAGIAAQPQPGEDGFNTLFNQFRDMPISEGGAKFLDKTGLWHAETKYNFSNIVDPEKVEFIAGANVRRYDLKSEGTLFALQADGDEFNIDEYGAYVQLSRDVIDNKLDLQGSIRYDKNEYFDGQFTPRISAVYTIAGNHNIRGSFQRGFRIPTTQTQFIDLDVVTRRLVGSNPVLRDRYNFRTNTVYRTESVQAARDSLRAGQSLSEVRQILQPVEFEEFETEKVSTFEVGYKSLIGGKLFIDAYYYYSSYQDFIAEIDFTQAVDLTDTNTRDGFDPVPGFDPDSDAGQEAIIQDNVPGGRLQRYGFDVNADGNVEAQGFALGMEYVLDILGGGFTLGGNVTYNDLISQEDLTDQGFRASYNTPEWRYNIQLRNRRLTDQVGFNVVYRWQDAYLWESSFGEGIIPAYGSLDAQVTYSIPQINTTIKVSGSNLLNDRHTTSFGNPLMGGIYLISLRFDQFMN
ncbi:MAG: TonB-dependent receptor, partial [Balneolaceae bacterium]|nr:TonB-dependent receptor [Balneolaceae bacterium]